MDKLKNINVVAAVIISENKFLATQRGYGEFKGLWEFPGGKIKPGEINEDALKREILEELQVEIKICDYLGTFQYDYSNFHLNMSCYLTELIDGKITLIEHSDAKWLTISDIKKVEWLPADLIVVERLIQKLKSN